MKYVQPGNATSYTTLALASNYESFESNVRRYNLVEYLQNNLLETLTDREKKQYFPLWDDFQKGVDLIKEAVLICPFKAEHADFKKAERDADKAKRIDVGTRYYNTLVLIQEAVEMADDEEWLGKQYGVAKMRPTAFAKMLADIYKGRMSDYLGQLLTFLTELKSKGQLKTHGGKTPLQKKFFDWRKIANDYTCGDDDESVDALKSIADDWDALLAEEF